MLFFADVLIIMGKATKSHRTYYYEHDPSTNLARNTDGKLTILL
jgi:hypothetical protein